MKDNVFYKQAELILRVLPLINREKNFALKGGTAINFFLQDIPRLSVDIDLVYLPIEDREATLASITTKLLAIGEMIINTIANSRVVNKTIENTDHLNGIIIACNGVTIKIEVNTTFRGSVYNAEIFTLSEKAEKLFELSLKTQCLSKADLYGGKICAALDRQHPRDLFDVKLLFDMGGLTDQIRKAFIVYLISHNRPIVEVLNPGLQDIEEVYRQEFSGMTTSVIDLKDLIEVRSKLIQSIKLSLTDEEVEFLLSFKNKEPNWRLLGLDDIQKLPSVRWKMENLNRMDSIKHKIAYEKLRKYLL